MWVVNAKDAERREVFAKGVCPGRAVFSSLSHFAKRVTLWGRSGASLNAAGICRLNSTHNILFSLKKNKCYIHFYITSGFINIG